MKSIALLTAALVLLASEAMAQTPTGIRSCSAGAGALNFGNFSGSRIDAASNITISCGGNGTNNPVTIALSQGMSNSFINRFMLSGSGGGGRELNYNLYIDGAFSIIWGNGAGETQVKVTLFDFRQIGQVTRSFSIFARVPAQNLPPPGHYTDTIIATVIF